MIGRLQGILIDCQPPGILIDVGGVGYDVLVPMTTLYQLPQLGQSLTVYTHLSVSEVSQQLFGFIEVKDRSLFRQLIKVSGIGPKMAMGIMSLESEEIVRCIEGENVATLVKIPGVGKRTAERLIVEMRGKLTAWQSDSGMKQTEASASAQHANDENLIKNEAESALINLGYKPTDASKAVAKAYSTDVHRSEDLIRLALKTMLPVS